MPGPYPPLVEHSNCPVTKLKDWVFLLFTFGTTWLLIYLPEHLCIMCTLELSWERKSSQAASGLVINRISGSWEMGQSLRALTALTQDLGLCPSTNSMAYSHLYLQFQGICHHFWSLKAPGITQCTQANMRQMAWYSIRCHLQGSWTNPERWLDKVENQLLCLCVEGRIAVWCVAQHAG